MYALSKSLVGICNCYEINTLVLNVRWIEILDTYLYYNTSTITWLFYAIATCCLGSTNTIYFVFPHKLYMFFLP